MLFLYNHVIKHLHRKESTMKKTSFVYKKVISLCLLLALTLLTFAACTTATDNTTAGEGTADNDTAKEYTVRVGAMTGPTGIGMVKLMADSEGKDDYSFEIAATAANLNPLLLSGKLDAAAVPANVASTLYNNSEGKIRVAAINTLGVLSIVERGNTVTGIADLKGKTIHATGAGTVPEYTLRYLLKENNIDPDKDVTFVWHTEAAEVLAYLKKSPDGAIAMLPQPYVTAARAQVEDLRIACQLNDAWDDLDNGTANVTGVLVVRRDFAENQPEAYARLMADYAASIAYVNTHVEEMAPSVEKYIGIKAGIAKTAIPFCNVTFVDGNAMKTMLSGYLSALHGLNPAAIGGKLPDEAFYLPSVIE